MTDTFTLPAGRTPYRFERDGAPVVLDAFSRARLGEIVAHVGGGRYVGKATVSVIIPGGDVVVGADTVLALAAALS